MANVMTREKRAAVLRVLAEGNSLRSTCRITGRSKKGVARLLTLLGEACAEFQDRALRELESIRVQCDEIWAFVGAKEGHVPYEQRGLGRGDVWTWTAIDAESKLLICWHVGRRDQSDATVFMHDLSQRLKNRPQISTDGLLLYRPAIADAFGSEVDYGTEIKDYGTPMEANRIDARYSPNRCVSTVRYSLMGDPEREHISTAFNERHNLTMRMSMRRFTRLTNAFSKKVENHAHAVAIHAMHYNFCRIHQTLRCTPAMEAGVADHVWSSEEVVDLITK